MEDQVLMEFARLLNRQSDAINDKDEQELQKVKIEIEKAKEDSEILKLYWSGLVAKVKKQPVPDGHKEIADKIYSFQIEDKYSVSKLSNEELFVLCCRLQEEEKSGIRNFGTYRLINIYERNTGNNYRKMKMDYDDEIMAKDKFHLESKNDDEILNLAVEENIKFSNEKDKEKRIQYYNNLHGLEIIYSKRTGMNIDEVKKIVSNEWLGRIRKETPKKYTKKSIQAHFNHIDFDDEKETIFTNIGFTPYNKILDYKLNESTQAISKPSTYQTKTDFGSVVGRSIVGGLLSGGIGALIGGATASKKTVQTSEASTKVIYNYELIITRDSTSVPNITLNFKEDKRSAEEAASMLSVIINRNKQNASSQAANSPSSIADELSKIADLKAKGIITDEEFNVMKKKIIGI